MTQKIEITDDAVERALSLYGPPAGWYDERVSGSRQSLMRAALEAAMNPPPIPVTKAMLEAAQIAYCTAHKFNPKAKSWLRKPWSDNAHAAIYRAMRALEPKP